MSAINQEGQIPRSLEAEKSVLGGVLLDQQAWDDVADIVTGKMFYHPAHQMIFEAMRSLAGDNTPLDVVTVSEVLETRQQLDTIGGMAVLAELARNTPSASNAHVYAVIVRDRYQLRELARISRDIAHQALNPQEASAEDIIEASEQQLFQLVEHQQPGLSSVTDMLNRAINVIDAAWQSEGGITGTPTGYPDLDAMTAGWQPGDLIVIAGRPSMGKTAMGLGLAENALLKLEQTVADRPVFIFSLEMPEEQLMLRLLASAGRLSLQKLRTGNLDDDDWPKLSAAALRIKAFENRLFIDDQAGISASTLKARARRMARQHGTPSLILIDYLQLLHESGYENRNLEISAISRILKGVAKELGAPVIALSQLNRSVENRPQKRPMMADLRDSGAIEQDADVIGFVYRDEVYHPDNQESHGLAELIIGKQRNGPIGTVHFSFLGESTRFESLARHHHDKEVAV